MANWTYFGIFLVAYSKLVSQKLKTKSKRTTQTIFYRQKKNQTDWLNAKTKQVIICYNQSVAFSKIVLSVVVYSKFFKTQKAHRSRPTYPKHSSNASRSSENEPFKEGHKTKKYGKKNVCSAFSCSRMVSCTGMNNYNTTLRYGRCSFKIWSCHRKLSLPSSGAS